MKCADGLFQYYYIGQAVADADHQVIVATHLNNAQVDIQQLIPMSDHTVGPMLNKRTVDAGYCSNMNLEHINQLETAIEFLIASGRVKHDEQVLDAPRGRIPKDATLRQRMAHKLRTKHKQESIRPRQSDSGASARPNQHRVGQAFAVGGGRRGRKMRNTNGI